MLEDKGVPYENSADNIYGPKGMMDCFRTSSEAVPSVSFPLLFPPAIWHRPKDSEEVMINQCSACMVYLGDILGYAPASAAERARANAITLNAMDYISEGRSSFHPVKNHMSYKEQREEGDRVSKEFSETRMKTFLNHFNKVVAKKGSQSPVAGGTSVTYADFALFHVLDATVSQFNTKFYGYAWDNFEGNDLKEYYQWMKERPNLQAYFKSDRCARKLL
jgi:glutathione S-transferase